MHVNRFISRRLERGPNASDATGDKRQPPRLRSGKVSAQRPTKYIMEQVPARKPYLWSFNFSAYRLHTCNITGRFPT